MKIVKLELPLYFENIKDIYNDNIDIFVELDDGITYTIVVTTPKFFYSYMDKEGLNYIPASPPEIIVRSLTVENIRSAVESYLENNAYWLKLYYLAGEMEGTFDIKLMDKRIKEIKKDNDDIENS